MSKEEARKIARRIKRYWEKYSDTDRDMFYWYISGIEGTLDILGVKHDVDCDKDGNFTVIVDGEVVK